MSVNIELYGLARQRAGLGRTTAAGARLGDVLDDLARRFPRLADECIAGRRLRAGFLANVAGRCFVSDPETPLDEGDTLLILSADAGG